jgi:hypothetical protein
MSSESRASGYLSAPHYFALVALVTGLGLVTAMALRPAFAHKVLETAGLEAMPQATPGSFYTVRVAPLFTQHCISCHGEGRQKAELRLDSFAFSMRGGRHGTVIRPGEVKASELMTRITLPAGDDRAMPPEGKTPLSPDDVTVIRLWIAAGASPILPAAAIKGAPRQVAEVTFPNLDPSATRRLREPLASVMQQLSARYPGILAYESRSSADLDLNAALSGTAFADDDLKTFLPLRGRIVLMDLSGTAVTDASAQAIAQMTALKTLRLTNTKTGDATVSALASLKSLRSLTVTGTGATKAALAPMSRRGVAIHGDGNAD